MSNTLLTPALARCRRLFLRNHVVDVRIGEPVETAGFSLDDRDQLIEIVRERIEALRRT